MELKIRLIRHGLTASNEAHKYLGLMEETLSRRGREMLIEKARKAKRAETDLLFVSPMGRCKETAEILFPGREGICIPEWTEIDFGDFEGKNFEELKDVATYQAWLASGGRLPFPGGESRETFIARSMQGYERMLAYVRSYSEDDHKLSVTAVVNGGTIMAVCSSLFGGDYFDYQIGCGGEYLCPSVTI
ncbi:MAG: histidine phosphatase family protein [Lachnospiraceae bacterium]|nr:histidine phosphatase family protein [Lachnospiraceae bacterium]